MLRSQNGNGPLTHDSLKNKMPQDAVIFGKPNVIVNQQGISFGSYINKTLNNFTAEELIDVAENYSGHQHDKLTVFKKINEGIKQQQQAAELDSELKRAEIEGEDHAWSKEKTKSPPKPKFDLNQKNQLRIFGTYHGSQLRKHNYMHELQHTQKAHISRAINGFDQQSIARFQVIGKN